MDRRRGAVPAIVLTAFLAGAVLTSWAAVVASDSVRVGQPEIALDAVAALEETLARMRADAALPGLTRVALLGDSTVMGYPLGYRVSERLQEALDDAPVGRTHRVYDFAQLGFGPPEHFCLADRIASARPEVVVLAFNLATLAPSWERRFRRPELAGWVPTAELPAAMALLMPMGVSLDELTTYQALVRLGGFHPWYSVRRQQARLEAGRTAVQRELGGEVAEPLPYQLNQPPGWYLRRPDGRDELGRVLLDQYAAAYSGVAHDRVSLEQLRHTIHVLRRGSSEVFVYAVPVNLDLVRRFTRLDDTGLERTLDSLRAVVMSTGASWLDYHDLLPTAGFRDVAGHFALRPVDGPREVGQRLANDLLARSSPR